VNDPRLLWWVDRSAGLVSLGLLTLVLALGILSVGRPPKLPVWRAVVQAVHRELPLVAVLLLAVHIGTAVADPHVGLGLQDVVVPFAAPWEPFWVGLGALAVDLIVVLVVTSLVRSRLDPRLWHALHVLAYAVWPLAVAHAMAVGTDAGERNLRWVGIGCLAAVLLALGRRLQVAAR
jgi:DMSO/TMAO reductase YedYZ heme-binding membrane subunit